MTSASELLSQQLFMLYTRGLELMLLVNLYFHMHTIEQQKRAYNEIGNTI